MPLSIHRIFLFVLADFLELFLYEHPNFPDGKYILHYCLIALLLIFLPRTWSLKSFFYFPFKCIIV